MEGVSVYARIGELLQGVDRSGEPFLVPGFSSSHYCSTAHLSRDLYPHRFRATLKEKAYRALILAILLEQGVSFRELKNRTIDTLKDQVDSRFVSEKLAGVALWQESTIPEGKGYSSSSADILGILSLLKKQFGASLNPDEIYLIAALVEPTDPCLESGSGIFLQNRGVWRERFTLPQCDMLFFDPEPDLQIDTLSLSAEQPYRDLDSPLYEELLVMIREASLQSRQDLLFQATRQSAFENQKRLKKPDLEHLDALAEELRAGLFVAHSGTVMGLLFPEGEELEKVETAIQSIEDHWRVSPIYESSFRKLRES